MQAFATFFGKRLFVRIQVSGELYSGPSSTVCAELLHFGVEPSHSPGGASPLGNFTSLGSLVCSSPGREDLGCSPAFIRSLTIDHYGNHDHTLIIIQLHNTSFANTSAHIIIHSLQMTHAKRARSSSGKGIVLLV